eukprot:488837-Rhodomonas_salina.1
MSIRELSLTQRWGRECRRTTTGDPMMRIHQVGAQLGRVLVGSFVPGRRISYPDTGAAVDLKQPVD